MDVAANTTPTHTTSSRIRRGFVDTTPGPIHYREAGEGFPLVLLHRTAESGEQFADVMPALAESFRVIAPDTLGFGDSAAAIAPPGMDLYARNAIEALDKLGVDRMHLLGHRTGASIAVEIAALFPDRVARLVLSGCPDYSDEARAALNVPRHERTITLDGAYLLDHWKRVVNNLGAGVTPAQVQRSFLMGERAAPHPYWAYEAVYAQDIHERLGHVTAPTLLMYGEHDPFGRWLPALTSQIANVRTHIFPGAHALTMYHIPDDFSRTVTAFLLDREG